MSWENIRRAIYPKVRQDKMWHRIVTVIGWVLSIPTYLLFLPIYFGGIQRIIFFIAYGSKKEEWLILEDETKSTLNKKI